MNIHPIEKTITHTYTSPEGVVFVITDVPALVVEGDKARQVRYKPAASRVINRYIREGLKLCTKPNVYSISFKQAEKGLSVDAQIRFGGD